MSPHFSLLNSSSSDDLPIDYILRHRDKGYYNFSDGFELPRAKSLEHFMRREGSGMNRYSENNMHYAVPHHSRRNVRINDYGLVDNLNARHKTRTLALVHHSPKPIILGQGFRQNVWKQDSRPTDSTHSSDYTTSDPSSSDTTNGSENHENPLPNAGEILTSLDDDTDDFYSSDGLHPLTIERIRKKGITNCNNNHTALIWPLMRTKSTKKGVSRTTNTTNAVVLRTPKKKANILPPSLEMIEEISPILPATSTGPHLEKSSESEDLVATSYAMTHHQCKKQQQDRNADFISNSVDDELPPVIQPLRLLDRRQWRPIKTSTLTNVHSPVVIGTREQFHQQNHPTSSQLSKGARKYTGNRLMHIGDSICVDIDGDYDSSSSTKPSVPYDSSTTTTDTSPRDAYSDRVNDQLQKNRKNKLSRHLMPRIRPEDFNLPSALAKCLGIRGILYLSAAIAENTLVILLRNGFLFSSSSAYFGDGIYCCPPSSVVRVEIRPNTTRRHRKRPKNADPLHCFRAFRTHIVQRTEQPEFFEEFRFRISMHHLKNGDKLTLSAFITAAERESDFDYSPKELVGRMSFSLRKFFRAAYPSALPSVFYQDSPTNLDDHMEENFPPIGNNRRLITVCVGGYFLLPDKTGLGTHLPQHNILHRKYYDEIGKRFFDVGRPEVLAFSPVPITSTITPKLANKINPTGEITVRRLKLWEESLEELLSDQIGRDTFQKFLDKEYSGENLKFWIEVQKLRKCSNKMVPFLVTEIYNEFIESNAKNLINIDCKVKEQTEESLRINPNRWSFNEAADHIFSLMKNDSYQRFLRSDIYQELVNISKKRSSLSALIARKTSRKVGASSRSTLAKPAANLGVVANPVSQHNPFPSGSSASGSHRGSSGGSNQHLCSSSSGLNAACAGNTLMPNSGDSLCPDGNANALLRDCDF